MLLCLKRRSLLKLLTQLSSCCQGRRNRYRAHASPWQVPARSNWIISCHGAIPRATKASNRSMIPLDSSVSPHSNLRRNSAENQWQVSPLNEVTTKTTRIYLPQQPPMAFKPAPSTSTIVTIWSWNVRCRGCLRIAILRMSHSHWSITSTAQGAVAV